MALPKIDVPTHKVHLHVSNVDITIRPWLVREEKMLLMASESDKPEDTYSTMTQILTNCIVEAPSSFKVETMPLVDMVYTFIHLRAHSVGNEIQRTYICKNGAKDTPCNAKVETTIDLLQVPVVNTPGHTDVIKLTDSIGLTLRYPSMKELPLLDAWHEKPDRIFELVRVCITSIFDGEKVHDLKDTPAKEIDEFLLGLQTEQFNRIADFFDTMPKLSLPVPFVCPKCGWAETLVLEKLEDFFG